MGSLYTSLCAAECDSTLALDSAEVAMVEEAYAKANAERVLPLDPSIEGPQLSAPHWGTPKASDEAK